MIPLSTIFEHLQFGELFNTALGGEEKPDKAITPLDYKQVGSYINLGLTALYRRFPVKYSEVVVQQYDEISLYYLRKDFALNSGSTEPIKYIIDSPEKVFLGDVMKITGIFNELGEELTLNDNGDVNTVYTPEQDCLQFSSVVDTNTVFVTYRAKPSLVELLPTMVSSDLDNIFVDIPDSMLTALLYYIGSRYYGSMAIFSETRDSLTYNQMYEMECSKIEQMGMIQSDTWTSTPVEEDGWV